MCFYGLMDERCRRRDEKQRTKRWSTNRHVLKNVTQLKNRATVVDAKITSNPVQGQSR